MSATRYPVFTVGHSDHSPATFVELLRMNGIEEVLDVRSSPYSRHTPRFNRDVLVKMLSSAGISYVFMGKELGGRPADRACYDSDGRVRYDLLAQTGSFDDGIRRILRNSDERRISLMCTERDPLDCHRALLVAKTLVERGVAVRHILANGDLEEHADAMGRLMDNFKLPRYGDLFRSGDEVMADALSRQARRVGYVRERYPRSESPLERIP